MKYPLYATILAVALGVVACESGPNDPPGPAESVTSLDLIEGTVTSPYFSGNTVPLQLRATDAAGMSVGGVKVTFRTTSGGGSVTPGEGTSDSLGIVRAQWTLGDVGTNALMVAVVGGTASRTLSLPVQAKPVERVVLSADSVTLAGPTCFTELSISGLTSRDNFVGFTIDQPAVLSRSITVTPRTGTVGWMYTGLLALAPGTARVIATDALGGADTAHVRVLGTMPQVAFQSDTVRMAVGDTTYLPVNASGACGAYWGNPVAEPSIVGDTSRVNTYSSDISALTVLPRANPTKQVVALKAGTVRVVTKYWGAADTATVVVQ